MPLAIISGYPCAGKTYRSIQLITNFTDRITSSADARISKLKIHHINDESLGVKRDVYATARAEKDARAEEMSAIKRLLSKDSLVITDGLNYIKGFRYQLFCEAKAVQTPCCVIHIGTPQPQCKSYHEAALTTNPSTTYSPSDFENLLFRYEEPNGMSRWDSPLFTVVHEDPDPPYDAIWTALTGETKDGPSGVIKPVKPNAATVLKPASASDYLYELDKATSEIVQRITEWQGDHVGEEGGEISLEGEDGQALVVNLPNRVVSAPQLQRVRRQFLSLNRQHSLEKERIRPLFVDYLNDVFGR